MIISHLICLAAGIFIGHVLFNPKRRSAFVNSLDVNAIKGENVQLEEPKKAR